MSDAPTQEWWNNRSRWYQGECARLEAQIADLTARLASATTIIAEYVEADAKVVEWAGCFLDVEPDGTGPGDSYTGAVPTIGQRLKRAQDWLISAAGGNNA